VIFQSFGFRFRDTKIKKPLSELTQLCVESTETNSECSSQRDGRVKRQEEAFIRHGKGTSRPIRVGISWVKKAGSAIIEFNLYRLKYCSSFLVVKVSHFGL